MSAIKRSLTIVGMLFLAVTGLLQAYIPSLPVDVKMTAEYAGYKTVRLTTTVQSMENVEGASFRITSSKGIIKDQGKANWSGNLEPSQPANVETIIEFDNFDEYVEVNIEITGYCEGCKENMVKDESFSLVLLKEGPWVTRFNALYDKLLVDEIFAERLGYLVGRSKLHKGGKGLFNYRTAGMNLEKAKAAHEKMFGSIAKETDVIQENLKVKKPVTRLSSVVSRSGRITYRDSVWEDDRTNGLPKAEVVVVVYYAPAYEETWGYATTDDDGYYTVNFNIPDGQTIYEQLVGIMVYSEYEAADIAVKSESTGNTFMTETIEQNGEYDYYIPNGDAFTIPARLHWSIIKSYITSSNNGFGGGGVDVEPVSYCYECNSEYGTNLIRVKTCTSRNTTYYVSHEHGHHLMGIGPSWPDPGCYEQDQGRCDTMQCQQMPWTEGWADFWGCVICSPLNKLWPNYSIPDSNLWCGGIDAYIIHNVSSALWDLYDSEGSDEGYSFWSKMDDAFTGPINTVYDYIDNLKAQYTSQATKLIIEAIIQLNLPPSEGLLLASAAESRSSLPRAYSLTQNYPNPFNPSTSISFSLPTETARLSLKIFDVRGKLVKTLVEGTREVGNHTVFWDGNDERGKAVTSGVYFYRLIADEFKQIRKMVLLK